MGEVINLRLQRKRAARRAAETSADANRTAHGLPKALRQTAEREIATRAARLDGHRLSGDRPAGDRGVREPSGDDRQEPAVAEGGAPEAAPEPVTSRDPP